MKRWQAALRFIGVGWFIGICIVLGVWGGLWLDNKFGTTPIFIIVGLLVGLTIAFYGVYRMIKPLLYNKKNNGKDD